MIIFNCASYGETIMTRITITLILAIINSSAFAGIIYDFELTENRYSSGNINLDSIVKSELGSSYRAADWNDIKNYNAEGYNISKLKKFENSMVTRNGSSEWCCNRQYYIDWSDRPNRTPYNNFLSHDNVGQLYLGSWFLNMPILGVREGLSYDIPQLDAPASSSITKFWYEDNYALDFVNPVDTAFDSVIDNQIDLFKTGFTIGGALLISLYTPQSPGPLFDRWVSNIETKVLGNARATTFGSVDLITASPSILYFDGINFDTFLGLSFDYESFGVSADDLLVVKSGEDIIYQLLGSDIMEQGSIAASFNDLSGIGDLSVGIYSNDAGKELTLDNFQFYAKTTSVPEPNSILLLFTGLLLLYLKRPMNIARANK